MHKDRLENSSSGIPICRFGPGGDYVRNWPAGTSDEPASSQGNPLGRILATLADMIGATLDPELLTEINPLAEAENIHNNPVEENISYAVEKSATASNAPPTPGSKSNSSVRGQSMLFSDDGRVSRPVRRKPHNRIRAHRRTSKKRSAHEIPGQGTLFEAHHQSQSAA